VRALPADAEAVVFLDGDGSQEPEEIGRVLAPLRSGAAGFVLGTRRFAGGHPLHASLGTRLVAGFVSWWYGVQVSDIGQRRAIRAGPLRRLRMRDRAFGWPVEMVVKAAALGGRIATAPVSHRPRQAGRSTVSGAAVGSLRAGSALLAAALRAAREVR
jgi:hypothetical protein